MGLRDDISGDWAKGSALFCRTGPDISPNNPWDNIWRRVHKLLIKNFSTLTENSECFSVQATLAQ